ncbi:MAG: L,D-transpeptidase [Anaerolineaceae bacterium]|nr:L,D-transpeptidase [Anaerolineaceae bacterium]
MNHMKKQRKFTRRDFLQLSLMGVGAVAMTPFKSWDHLSTEWSDAERLGRVCVGKLDIRLKPSINSQSVGILYEDMIVVWLREVIGEAPGLALGRRWVQIPEGYVYAPSIQPVEYHPNEPVQVLPETNIGRGFWAEVTVPYVDLALANPPARAPWLKAAIFPRLYYSQVMWVDDIRINAAGITQYRVNEKYGTYGDIFWAEAEGFRVITEADIAPIHPEAGEKMIQIDLNHQVLSCFEGSSEVYFCRISSGAKYDAWGEEVEEWATPTGSHYIWRKLVSIHMAGGTVSGGYDLPGIPWTCLFIGDGVAIHSTFWHNNYGTPRSHGCINARPEDAKWIFRWTSPVVSLDPGDITVNQMFTSTNIKVIES